MMCMLILLFAIRLMTKKIFTIIALIFAIATPFSHAEKTGAKKQEMHLAAVSKTNPYEIVPAAGMEIFGDIDDQADFAMIDDMLQYARKFMGTRYVRGGKSPKGFDCSGFTSYVFGQFGVSLSPSSSTQYGQGTKVSKGEVQPGDLLFFTGRAANGRVGHVAIAIDADPVSGEVTFIHASTSGGVKIDKTTAPYYAKRYLGARRVIGQ